MGQTIEMQKWITLRASRTTTASVEISQPAANWLDCRDFRHLVLNTHIIEHTASNATTTIYIETAQSPSGPWKQLTSFATGGGTLPIEDVSSFTDDAGGPAYLQRFVRWRFKMSPSAAPASWEACFRICATLRGS